MPKPVTTNRNDLGNEYPKPIYIRSGHMFRMFIFSIDRSETVMIEYFLN